LVTYDFLLTFHINHGPTSYRFPDKCVLNSPAEWGSPWNWVTLEGLKKQERWGYQAKKKV